MSKPADIGENILTRNGVFIRNYVPNPHNWFHDTTKIILPELINYIQMYQHKTQLHTVLGNFINKYITHYQLNIHMLMMLTMDLHITKCMANQ